MLHVVMRACDCASLRKSTRPFGLEKKELMKVCFRSLMASLVSVPVIVVGDRLSEEMITFYQQHAKVINSEKPLGDAGSFRKCLDIAGSKPDEDFVYLLEDDYLHHLNFYPFTIDFLTEHPDVYVHPSDYPDQYLPSFMRPGHVWKTDFCHWRQVTSSTFTFLCRVDELKNYMDYWQIANDAITSSVIFREGEAMIFSPLPGLATHMHEGVMSSFVDWERIASEFTTKEFVV